MPKAHVLLSLFHILNQDLYKTVKYHTLRPFATGRKKWLITSFSSLSLSLSKFSNQSLFQITIEFSVFFLSRCGWRAVSSQTLICFKAFFFFFLQRREDRNLPMEAYCYPKTISATCLCKVEEEGREKR